MADLSTQAISRKKALHPLYSPAMTPQLQKVSTAATDTQKKPKH